jgi:glycerophosphoryl diester phosphodiesterase
LSIGVGPEASDLTKQNVKNLKKAGLLVHPFTVNDPIYSVLLHLLLVCIDLDNL